MRKAAIILAGGEGKRFGGEKPKQFLLLNGKKVIDYSIEKFLKLVDEVVIVCHKDYISELKDEYNLPVVSGGDTRQLSVKNGLTYLLDKSVDFVAIHDSARPLFDVELVVKMFNMVMEKGAVIPVSKVNSSLCEVFDGEVKGYIPRDRVYNIETPQVFKFDLIYKAHEIAFREGKVDFTDDSQLIKYMGHSVSVLENSRFNIKITTKSDLILLENYINKVKL